MSPSDRSSYVVQDGKLQVNGTPLALGKGLVLLALLRAGWKGEDGPLPDGVADRLRTDPRTGLLFR